MWVRRGSSGRAVFARARYFDPAAGRFLSEDPIGFNAGDQNLYRYVLNNPLNFRDPFGLEPGLPTPPLSDDKMRPLTDDQLKRLQKDLRKSGQGEEARKVEKFEKTQRDKRNQQKQRTPKAPKTPKGGKMGKGKLGMLMGLICALTDLCEPEKKCNTCPCE